jgi:hypothetical protein
VPSRLLGGEADYNAAARYNTNADSSIASDYNTNADSSIASSTA